MVGFENSKLNILRQLFALFATTLFSSSVFFSRAPLLFPEKIMLAIIMTRDNSAYTFAQYFITYKLLLLNQLIRVIKTRIGSKVEGKEAEWSDFK